MKKTCITFLVLFLLSGCGVTKISTTKLESQITLEANKNYLPGGVMGRPEYTVYDESTWDCKYQTENNDYVCCSRESFSTMSPWKYCLLVDQEYNAFAYFELGVSSYRNWPEGKQPIFQISEK